MLERRQRLSWTDRSDPAFDGAAPELDGPAPRRSRHTPGLRESVALGVYWTLVRSRLLVGVLLIAAGAVWAIARGLHVYGVSLAGIGYDLDQPPLLLVLVAIWILLRRRRR